MNSQERMEYVLKSKKLILHLIEMKDQIKWKTYEVYSVKLVLMLLMNKESQLHIMSELMEC